MTYELQGKDKHGNWDADNVSHNPDATMFDTRSEAQAEFDYWVSQGRKRDDLRIVECPSSNEL